MPKLGYMWLLSKMQQAATLPALDSLFRRLCILALSKEERLDQLSLPLPPPTPDDSDIQDDYQLPPDEEHPSKTYRTRTSFGRHFEDVAKRARADDVRPASTVVSRYFCPDLVEYLLSSVMPFAPLWSQILSSSVTTNAAVESHMRVVKRQLLRGRTRLRPGDFVRVLLRDSASRMKADIIPARPLPRGKKRKLADALAHPECQEECWAKRDGSKKPTWYARNRPPRVCTVPGSYALPGPTLAAAKTGDQGTAPAAAQPRPRGLVPAAVAQSVPREWLSDEAIDVFCESVASPPVLALSVFWRQCVAGACRRCMVHFFKQLGTYGTWLLPLNVGHHWVLFVVSWSHRRLVYCDSLGFGPRTSDTKTAQLLMTAATPDLEWTGWRLVVPETPRQTDGWSCGYRVCWLAQAAATGKVEPYTGETERNIHARIRVRTPFPSSPISLLHVVPLPHSPH